MPPFSFYPQVYTRKKNKSAAFIDDHGPMSTGSASGYTVLSTSFTSVLPTVPIPTTHHELLKHAGRLAAMKTEMAALHSNKTWELTSLPAG